MSKPVVNIVKTILLICEAEVALFIEPYFWWVEILDQNPLSDIKFPALY